MALLPDPLQELLDLQERMNRLFEQTLGRERPDEPHLHATWEPAADVFETPAGYVIEVDLPGLRREDVDVQAEAGEIVVRGEKPPSAVDRPETFHRLERRHGPFVRAFRLPHAIDADRIVAELADGVLRVSVPKTRSSRRVPVESGS
jgi:HSP20 family protein